MLIDGDKRLWWEAYKAALTGRLAYCSSEDGFSHKEASDDAMRAADMALHDYHTACAPDEPNQADPPWTGHARVELMGHRSYLGRIREIDRYGSRLGEVQELLASGEYGETHLFGGKSVYEIREVSLEVALVALRPERHVYCGANNCGAYIQLKWGDADYGEDRPFCGNCKAAIAVPLPDGAVCARCEKPAVKRDVHADPWCGECVDLPF